MCEVPLYSGLVEAAGQTCPLWSGSTLGAGNSSGSQPVEADGRRLARGPRDHNLLKLRDVVQLEGQRPLPEFVIHHRDERQIALVPHGNNLFKTRKSVTASVGTPLCPYGISNRRACGLSVRFRSIVLVIHYRDDRQVALEPHGHNLLKRGIRPLPSEEGSTLKVSKTSV